MKGGMGMAKRIAVVGGANMDIGGFPSIALVAGDSNPGKVRMTVGGVGRNIAENMTRMGLQVELITALGDDANGRAILHGCEQVGIDMKNACVLPGERSSSYVSIVDETGDMLMAMSDMHIIKRMDERFVDDHVEVLSNADLVVCDGNLSARTMERLTEVCLSPLYLDPVSTAWAKEMAPFVGSFDTIKPNRFELGALSGKPVDTESEVIAACEVLLHKGVRRLFVSLGQKGMLYYGREGRIRRVAKPYPDVVNATGAGDASMAGIVWASRQGMTADECVCVGMAAGMIAIASKDTISREMTPENIQRMVEDYIV